MTHNLDFSIKLLTTFQTVDLLKKSIHNKYTAEFENDSLRRKRFRASSSRKLGQEQKQMKDGGVRLFLLPL